MNKELKAIIDELFDLEHVVVDAAGKKDLTTVIVPDVIAAGKDVMGVVGSWADLKAEVAALAVPANQADLESYVLGKIVGTSAKAQAIIASAIDLINGAEKLYLALKM